MWRKFREKLKWQPEPLRSQLVQFKNGTELGTPGDEYNKSPWREGCSRTVS